MMTVADKIKEALKNTDSQNTLTIEDLHKATRVKYHSLQMWLDNLFERGAIQRIKHTKDGKTTMQYWASGVVKAGVWNSPVTQHAKELQAVKKLEDMKSRELKTSEKPRDQVSKVNREIANPPSTDPKSKGFKILFAIEQKPQITFASLSEQLGFTCYQAHIQSFINKGLVIQQEGHGRARTLSLKEGYTAREVYNENLASAPRKKSATTKQPKQEAVEDKPAEVEHAGSDTMHPFIEEVASEEDKQVADELTKLGIEIPAFVGKALSAVDDPKAQFSLTSDDTLIIKLGKESIELNPAQSIRLLEFIDNKARFALRQQTIINQSTTANQ